MRIVSLLPSATEIVYALGLGDQLVGVTHECDYPADAKSKPVVTASAIDHGEAASPDIDQSVSAQLQDRLSLYTLDEPLLAELQPDLIITQALCAVCAVDYAIVERAVREIAWRSNFGAPRVLSLEPTSLADVLQSIRSVGRATDSEQRADTLAHDLHTRIEQVRDRSGNVSRRPRVACLEWIDPLFGPGHWLPEMVAFAGGEPGLGKAGSNARRIAWSDVIAFAPEVVVVTPCGMDLERAAEEAQASLPYRAGWGALPAVRAGRVFAVDGNAYFSRPGPRLVDSLELLAELIHPDLFAGFAPPGSWAALRLQQATSAGEQA